MAEKRISRRRWLAAKYNRDNRCHYCGVRTYLFDGPLMATVDHKVPQSARRWNHWTNYALACRTCNSEKGSMDYEQFKRRMSAQGTLLRENSRSEVEGVA